MTDVSQETLALRIRIEELEEANRQLRETFAPKLRFPPDWGLTASEARGLAALYTSPNGFRTKEMLHCAMRRSDDSLYIDAVRVRITHLRQKLRPRGITIQTLRSEGGWALPSKSRAMIAQALSQS